jgi:hypothetical protein
MLIPVINAAKCAGVAIAAVLIVIGVQAGGKVPSSALPTVFRSHAGTAVAIEYMDTIHEAPLPPSLG